MRLPRLPFPLLGPLGALTLLVVGVPFAARSQVPSTDIFLFEVGDDGLSEPLRVTDRPGYDNQPAFLPDGALVFTSMKEDGTTDILLYVPVDESTTTLVSTPQSEYSPTPVAGASALSVIRDYGNEVQELWRFDLSRSPDGSFTASDGELLLPDVHPVGYHAWIDDTRLLLFVLGDPPTLQRAEVGPGPGKVLAHDPGRALARIPGSREMSFVHKAGEGEWWLTAIDPDSGEMHRLCRTLPEREDYAWAPDGTVWMGLGSRLFRRRPGVDDWQEVAELSGFGIDGITRLAFDAEGAHLALVAERPPE